MIASIRAAQPLLQALAVTGLAVLAFAALMGLGVTTEASLVAALILAGMLNIGALVSLNGEAFDPTCRGAVGES